MKILSRSLNDEAVRRALSAYYRYRGYGGSPDAHSSSEHVQHEGLEYVVLANGFETLAVHRLGNNDRLRRLRRWPEAMNNAPTGLD